MSKNNTYQVWLQRGVKRESWESIGHRRTGFIGSHVVELLVEGGYQVLALDCFDREVHLAQPDYLDEACGYVRADVWDARELAECHWSCESRPRSVR